MLLSLLLVAIDIMTAELSRFPEYQNLRQQNKETRVNVEGKKEKKRTGKFTTWQIISIYINNFYTKEQPLKNL